MAEKKNWIQEAVERMKRKGTVGAFTEYCKRKGYSGVTQACINEAKKSNNPTIRKRAIFAENMRKISRRRKS